MRLPVFIEHSRIPVWLSWFSPVDIGAITIGPFVFSKGELDTLVRNHEAIHWEQYKEVGVIAYPFLYAFYYLLAYVKFKDGAKAYYAIPFEQEAYYFEKDMSYLKWRRQYAWRMFDYKRPI